MNLLLTAAVFAFAYAAIVLMLSRQDERRAKRETSPTPENDR